MGEISALVHDQQPEWFNDQVTHGVDSDLSTGSDRRRILANRKRKDLEELVGREIVQEGVKASRVAHEILALERRSWMESATPARKTMTKEHECRQYIKANARLLHIAYALYLDLKHFHPVAMLSSPSAPGGDEVEIAATAGGLYWAEKLLLYKEVVSTIESDSDNAHTVLNIKQAEGSASSAVPGEESKDLGGGRMS